ncbi:sensor histidine kinase [Dokdonella sp.]|uniref:sensor histidine kinase n=1 Tax=Dokdonella sp. TaxID=2291710 RepID=UPI0035281466
MRSRLMLAFAGISLFVALLFSGIAVLFLYTVEDRFFHDALQSEAQRQLAHHEQFNRWTLPHNEFMTVFENAQDFPDDLREAYLAEPARSEFRGAEGRHYHLVRLAQADSAKGPAFLVAEVNQQLVVRRMRSSILEFLAWSVSLVVGIALGLGFWLARRMSAPLAELASQVEAMQPDDPPLDSAQVFRSHEVEVLARKLAALTTRVHDFVEREREFSRDVSHELRTPLAVIRSGCERLEQDRSLSVAARRQIGFVSQSAWQMQQCVGALLSLAREQPVDDTVEQTALILPVIEQVVMEQGLQLEGKPVEVSVDVDPELQMRLPRSILHILLGNLVGNAFAHTGQGHVRIDTDAGRLRITNSQAMPDLEAGDLFEPFAKGESSAGFGLGLAIVRRLCERYQIDLRIESGPQGTCASLDLDRTPNRV